MDLRQLEYLVAVADRGTYQAAAAALHVAQPGLWRRVKDLERELGTTLFERVGRRVRFTRDGAELLVHARAVLAAAKRLTSAASDLRSGCVGVVTITCASPHLRGFLAPVIASLRARAPGIRVDIREYGAGPGPGRGIASDLLDGLADVATGMMDPADRRFEGFALYDVGIVAAVPDGHRWRANKQIDIGRLKGQPLITAQKGSFSRGKLEAACARAGFAPTIAFDTPSPVTMVALGAAGLGVPIFAEDAIGAPRGRAWPRLAESGRPMIDVVGLGWRAGVELSPAVQAFVDLARTKAQQRRG